MIFVRHEQQRVSGPISAAELMCQQLPVALKRPKLPTLEINSGLTQQYIYSDQRSTVHVRVLRQRAAQLYLMVLDAAHTDISLPFSHEQLHRRLQGVGRTYRCNNLGQNVCTPRLELAASVEVDRVPLCIPVAGSERGS
jgi:hypothetical protein